MEADPRVIAVAAVNADGRIASYTTSTSSSTSFATQDNITSGGCDTITAGSATITITASGAIADTMQPQAVDRPSSMAAAPASCRAAPAACTSRLDRRRNVLQWYQGNNVLTAIGTANDVPIAGAAGETPTAGARDRQYHADRWSGNDIMTAGVGRTAFTTGAGNDQITLGGIADTITFQDGAAEGLSVIRGFRIGIDDLHLLGFAAGTAGAAVQAQTFDGASGTMLCLPDGTHIDLVELAHVTTSAFA